LEQCDEDQLDPIVLVDFHFMLPPLSHVISKGCLNGGIRIVDENSKDLCSSISDQIHGLVGMAHG